MTDQERRSDAVAADSRGSILAITVAPRSSRSALERTADGSIRLRVTAPPVEGAANEAVLEVLARELGIPRSKLQILAGASGRHKRILCEDVAPEDLSRRLLTAQGG